MLSQKQTPAQSPAAAVPPRPAGLHQGARPFTAAAQRRRRALRLQRAASVASQESTVAAPRAPSAPELDVDSQSAAALQPQSLELAPLSEANVTAQQPVSKFSLKRQQRKEARQREQMVYKVSAIAASLGVTSLAVAAVWLRFHWHMEAGGEFPWAEAAATLLLTIGGAIGMELWAQFAHKALWHDFEPGWKLHKSHHVPRLGAFEDNDVFAIVNAIPAMGLCLYGFLTPNVGGGLCFGAGLGITLFGISYMFIHDGLVHRRFPVGPIAEVPYLKRVAIAHKLHHSEKFDGVPWGLFLGPMELEKVGGREELDKMVKEHNLATSPKK